jgi:transcriptional regulator with XRE-family HTH domain
MALGDRLKSLREAAGLTQERLARAADVSVSAVAKIEHAGIDPAWSTVVRIARGLGVSLGAFDEDTPPPAAAPSGKPARAKGKGKK